MFGPEMDELGLGGLDSADLLFPDELLNLPPDGSINYAEESGGPADKESAAWDSGFFDVSAEKARAKADILAAEAAEQPMETAEVKGEEEDLLARAVEQIKPGAIGDNEPSFSSPNAVFEIVVPDSNTVGDATMTDCDTKSVAFYEVEEAEPTAVPSAVGVVATAAHSSPDHSAGSDVDDVDGQEDNSDAQSLIDQMEEFLQHHERLQQIESAPNDQNNSIGQLQQPRFLEQQPAAPTTTLTAAREAAQAEQLLSALASGNVASVSSAGDLAGLSINNVSELVTKDGRKIVIVIANDEAAPALQKQQQHPFIAPASPASSLSSRGGAGSPGPSESSDDSDWAPPAAATSTAARLPAKRPSAEQRAVGGGRVTKGQPRGPLRQRSGARYNVADKRERKKLQNVVAARRYRDKKKSEQCSAEREEEELLEKNRQLRERAAEAENELRTLKKLMLELGLVKVSPATAIALQA